MGRLKEVGGFDVIKKRRYRTFSILKINFLLCERMFMQGDDLFSPFLLGQVKRKWT